MAVGNSFFILKTMNTTIRTFGVSFLFLCVAAFADDPVETVATVNPSEMQAELNVRDSVMAARENACKAETDSLRGAIAVEQAKSANWEQSYKTVMQDNNVCQQALRVSIDSQTEKKGERNPGKDAAMMSGSAFLGGVGIGMLLFWLIFD